MLTLCIPVLNNFSGLDQMIDSAEYGDLVPDRYLIVDNSGGRYKNKNKKVEIYNPGTNIGVAPAWNYSIKNSDEIRIICNDDLIFLPETLKIFYEFVCNDKDSIMWCPAHNAGNAYSCFAINNKCIELLGYFDEEFAPAYFEDCDYARRMLLINYEITKVPDCKYIHVGSQTVKNYNLEELNKHHETFAKNQEYFIRKWGGIPGQEIYTIPFGK